MINCRKYTRYLHKSEIKNLKWYETLLMKYHFLICKWCQKYTAENKVWNCLLSEYTKSFLFQDNEIEQYKNELLQKLNI